MTGVQAQLQKHVGEIVKHVQQEEQRLTAERKGVQKEREAMLAANKVEADKLAKERAAFEEPLKEYVRLLGACRQAIGAREAALRTLNGADGAVAAKRERLQKLRSAGGKEEKANALARELKDAETAAVAAKEAYDAVAARLDDEMARFQREKLADFKRMVTAFVSLQLEYSNRVQAHWRDLLPKLEAIDDASVADGG